LEALSRGAAHTVFVEKELGPLEAIRQNIDMLSLRERVTVIPLAVLRVIPSLPAADLIFCDPPYALADIDEVVGGAFLAGKVKPGGTFVLETRAKRAIMTPSNATLYDERVYGDTKLLFYKTA
jgi:16S rRNA (guanine966-N2)-methyltransferase